MFENLHRYYSKNKDNAHLFCKLFKKNCTAQRRRVLTCNACEQTRLAYEKYIIIIYAIVVFRVCSGLNIFRLGKMLLDLSCRGEGGTACTRTFDGAWETNYSLGFRGKTINQSPNDVGRVSRIAGIHAIRFYFYIFAI